jgi:ArsR family transcriptional regulator
MDKQLATMETVFQALGDKTRLRILGLLLAGEVCVCHIHESLGMSQPKVSRHLAYLRRSGLVETRRQGLWVYYRLAENHDALIRTIGEVVTHTLGHLATVRRDAVRLQRKTGCCLPASASPVLSCCGGVEAPVSGLRERYQKRELAAKAADFSPLTESR